jgi:hypothetical protein
MKRLVVLFAICMSLASTSSAAVQMTFGECSPIINLNLANKEDLEKLFGPAPFQVERIASATATLVNCANDHVSDAAKRLEVLVFALDQQVFLKETFFLPALRRYETDHDLANLRVAERYAKIVSGKIEDAIAKYGAIGLDGPSLRYEQHTLATLDQNTTKLLSQTLDKKMRMTLDIEGGYGVTIESVHEFVRAYEEAVENVKSIRDGLKAELAATGR